ETIHKSVVTLRRERVQVRRKVTQSLSVIAAGPNNDSSDRIGPSWLHNLAVIIGTFCRPEKEEHERTMIAAIQNQAVTSGK
ncbi:hypothetical protein BaRGS_00015743, partial [Batillaria attramentaria]